MVHLGLGIGIICLLGLSPLAATPQRIVSLAPAITETLFILDPNPKLVGVTTACNFPNAAKILPKVGDFLSPQLEEIMFRQPDYIVAMGYPEGPIKQSILRLRIPTLWIKSPHSVAHIHESIRLIGRLINKSEEAEIWISHAKIRYQKLSPLSSKKRPRVVVLVWASPLIMAGSNTFIQDIVRLAGGDMAISSPVEYPKISPEQLLVANPDVIILTQASHKMLVLKIPGILKTKAGHHMAFKVVDADLICRPGPRWVNAVKAVREALR